MKKLKKKIMRLLRKQMPHVASALRSYRSEKRLDKPFSIHPNGFKFRGHASMELGFFEPEEAKLFAKLIEYVDIFVNVGANVGYYSCMAAHRGTPVLAFEPIPENAKILMENVAVNGWQNVEVYPLALGDRPIVAPMFGTGTGASLVEGWAGIPSYDRRYLPVNTFDNLITRRAELLMGRLLVWIDVEGFEYEVLKGAGDLFALGRDDIWVVEICVDEHMPEGQRINPRLLSTFDLFFEYGLIACEATEGLPKVHRASIEEIVRTGINSLETHNFIFLSGAMYERIITKMKL